MAAAPEPTPQGVDARAARFNQALTGTLTLAAFALDARGLVPITATLLLASALGGPRWNAAGHLFRHAVRPMLRLGNPTRWKAAAPLRFANLLGGLFLTAATFTHATGFNLLAWLLVLAVAALALLAASTGLCVGCELYALARRFRTPRTLQNG